MTSTDISFLTVVEEHTGPHHLATSLAAIRANGTGYEHVVVDNATSDPAVARALGDAGTSPQCTVVRLDHRLDDAAALRVALDHASGIHVMEVGPEDELLPDTAASMLAALVDADVAYCDHGIVLPDGRFGPTVYKPAYSPEHLRHRDYISPSYAARRSLIDDVGGFGDLGRNGGRHDLLLRLAERAEPFAHVPDLLYRRRRHITADTAAEAESCTQASLSAVRSHCERVGIDAAVTPGSIPGTVRVDRRLSGPERISVVIPTRGTSRRVWGVERCFVVEAVRSLVDNSTTVDLEIVVVHDDVTPPAVLTTLRELAGDRLVLVPYAEPFNFSRKLNVGVAASNEPLVLLLNDDTELIEPTSLDVLASHLTDTDVGMVGPKLLFADGTIQDGGHVYNVHVLPGLSGWHGSDPGPAPLHPLSVARETSGVTAAVALVRREVFDEVGGFDETFPVNFNDVDFSLKIRATGRRVIWTPWASWHHFESQTREPTATPAEFHAIDARWHRAINNDPYYNPNLPPYRADWFEPVFRSGEPDEVDTAHPFRWIASRLARRVGRTRSLR